MARQLSSIPDFESMNVENAMNLGAEGMEMIGDKRSLH